LKAISPTTTIETAIQIHVFLLTAINER